MIVVFTNYQKKIFIAQIKYSYLFIIKNKFYGVFHDIYTTLDLSLNLGWYIHE